MGKEHLGARGPVGDLQQADGALEVRELLVPLAEVRVPRWMAAALFFAFTHFKTCLFDIFFAVASQRTTGSAVSRETYNGQVVMPVRLHRSIVFGASNHL